MNREISLGNFKISNNLPITLIAGPCQIESEDHALMAAEYLVKLTDKTGINFIYKSSFDKANRTSIDAKRGVGIDKGAKIFEKIKSDFHCKIITDVHSNDQCSIIAPFVDILQIPALLCRQTDLLKSAAETQKIVNVKKGQFLSPYDMHNIVEKIESFGNKNIMLTERGASFGYNNLISDMRSLSIMAETGVPIIFDATHSVQKPGSAGNASGGERKFVEVLAKAAVAVGVSAIFMETHPDPDNAPSDGPCMIPFNQLESLIIKLMKIDQLTKNQ